MDINNTDDLRKAIEEDERRDQLELAAAGKIKMSVREYAKARGIQPQNVYYYVRKGSIKQEPCGECGRKVINIEQADAIFAPKEEPEDE